MPLVLSAIVAAAAFLLRALTLTGAFAAAMVGAIALRAGWWWAALLVLFFTAATLASRVRSAHKTERTSGVVSKLGARDARQVLANGGVFALCGVAQLLHPSPLWWWAAAGSLAAAASDTFATEIGTLSSAEPRSILTGCPVPAGTSGGVSWPGTLGAVIGALIVAIPASAVAGGGILAAMAFLLAGVLGGFVDSLIGASVQQRRWCATCEQFTEREVHSCGTPTRHAGGLKWLDNDAVNLLATLSGALVGGLLALPAGS